jgi:hypothetical protein
MKQGAMRKLIRGTTLSLLALVTTTGIAGFGIMTADFAVSQPGGPDGGSTQGSGSSQPDPTSIPTPTPTSTPTPVPLPVP